MSETATSRQQRIAMGVCFLLALALVAGAVGLRVSNARRQQRAVEALCAATGQPFRFADPRIQYDYELNDQYHFTANPLPGPDWLREKLGIDFLATVRSVRLIHGARAGLAEPLAALSGLQNIELTGPVAGIVLDQLPHLPQLERLILTSVNITDQQLAALSNLRGLRSLGLINCHTITDRGLEHVARIAGLRKLQLDATDEITQAGLEPLCQLKNLKSLRLAFLDHDDLVLERLATLPNLRLLHLEFNDTSSAGGLKHLSEFPALEELEIELSLSDSLTDDDVAQLPELPRLTWFFLSGGGHLTSAALACLDRMPNLRELDLCQTEVSDLNLPSIGRMKELRELAFLDCPGFSDAGLSHLAGLKKLESMKIYLGVPTETISLEGIETLRKSLPHCQIEAQ